MKTGEIIPDSKKTITKEDSDLRPITLTAILSKCCELVVLPKCLCYVKPSLDNLQFAYLTNRSTEVATLSTFIHSVTQYLDQSPSNYAWRLSIDYISAFNTMQPHLLLDKLQQHDVHPGLQLWILDFLTNRGQYVRTEKESSPIIKSNTGGPQGCVLSVFIFIVYMPMTCQKTMIIAK